MWRSVAPRFLVVLLVAIPLGCYDVKPPPVPTTTRVPTIVGEALDWADPPVSVRLDTGDVVSVGARDEPGRTGALTKTPVNFPSSAGPGSLVLAGQDDLGPFYAATLPGTKDGCFRLSGQGYTEAGRIHLSSGLVLTFAPDVAIENGRFDQYASWLMDFDTVCVDRGGLVTSILKQPFGA